MFFFFLVPFWSELIQVVKGCCVFTQSRWREILNQQWASGCALKQAGRHVAAGYRLCRPAETQRLQQLEVLPGYVSLADVSARLVHQAKLLFSPEYMCVCIKSDLFSLVTSYMFKIQSAHTQINISNSQQFV